MPSDPLATGVFDRCPAALEVVPELRGGEAELEPMSVGVERDKMTLGNDLPHQLGAAPDLLADQEERRFVSRAREDVEDRGRPLGMRSVVEGEHGAAGVWQRPRKTERSRGVCIHWCKSVA